MELTTIKKAADQIRENLQTIKSNGGGTHYFDLIIGEEVIEIRTSDHSGRSANNKGNRTFSFITNWNNQDSNISNEWLVDEDGDFSEEFINIGECIDWNL